MHGYTFPSALIAGIPLIVGQQGRLSLKLDES